MDRIEFLEQQAIDAAVKNSWEQAISINKQILELDPVNVQASLRMGFSMLQIGDIAGAKSVYKTVIKLQPKNHIANDHLEKISVLELRGGKRQANGNNPILDPNLFLEIPGKTKTVRLVNLGQKEDLAGLAIGQPVLLKLKKRRIEVRTPADEYVGCLPDDVSKRLTFFLQEKSQYKSYIKETSLNDVVIFIKEEQKGPKVVQYPSFPSNPLYLNDINKDKDDSGDHDDDELEPDEWLAAEEHDEEEDNEKIPLPHEEDEVEEEE